jgi:autotransporter translocation and assembly factor TamB
LITSDGPVDVRYARRELTVNQAALRVDDSTLRFSGNLPLDSGAVGELKVEGQTSLATLADLLPTETPVLAQGTLVLNGSFRGNLKRIDPQATITVDQASISSEALSAPVFDVNLRAALRDGQLVLERLSGEWASAKINVRGEVPFALLPELPIEIPRPSAPARLSAEVLQFRLSTLAAAPENIDGTISVKLEAEAPRPDIDSVQAQITFPDLRLNAGAYTLEQTAPSVIEVRNGVATVRQFELTGPQTKLIVSGSADLRDGTAGSINAMVEGNTDAAVLALFNTDVRATGDARLSVAATGTLREPRLNGFVELENGDAFIEDPRVAVENVRLRLDLNGSRIDVARLEGTLNGGALAGEGRIDIAGPQQGTSSLTLTADGVYLEFPEGLRTVSNARLNVGGDFPRLKLSGTVDVLEGSYTDPLTVERGVMRYLESEQSTITVDGEPGAVSRAQLDIGVRTLSPITVNNNIARGNITAELRVLGTVDQPGLTGRVEVEEGAELRLRERKYAVDRAVITFTNEQAIEPILDVVATTQVAKTNITMTISGDATRKLETVLTSDANPPLAESDLVSLLATGRILSTEYAGDYESVTGNEATIAKEQVMSYIAGELGTSVTDEVGRAIGLSQVRIEPNLIAAETEPTARLTIGKDITPELSLVYSMNLRDSNDQIWIANYDVSRRFSARGLRQEDNTYRFQFQHDISFGLEGMTSSVTSTPALQRKIGAIRFVGEAQLTEQQLARATGLRTGKNYDFFSVQNARQKLAQTFIEAGRLEARISVDRMLGQSAVDLTFRISEGPKVEFVFEGWQVPNDLKEQVRDVWSVGVIDVQRSADARDLINSSVPRFKAPSICLRAA